MSAHAAAVGSMVLLKNVGQTLPLEPAGSEPLPVDVFGMGELNTAMHCVEFQPWRTVSILDGLCQSELVQPDGLLTHKYRSWKLHHPGEAFPWESLSMEELAAALRPDTVLVSMMLVNNELGTVNPIREAASLIKRSGSPALLHCDAVQGFMKVPFTVKELGADFVAVSGHKIHAPKGIGALYVRNGLKVSPMIRGGGQESGLRSGTEATAQIAAFAAAVQAGKDNLERDLAHMAEMKAYAARTLQEKVSGLILVGEGTAPHILPISMPGYKSEVVLRFLSDRGVYVSSGSACHKGKPSHVYAALGLQKKILDGVLRISFSYDTSREDIDALAEGLAAAQKGLFTSLS